MFTKINYTAYPPKDKPLMIYDGNCGFCKYWIIKWKKISGSLINYSPYQAVKSDFKDIDEIQFKEAVRLVLPSGEVLDGPEAAYYTYFLNGKSKFLYQWYGQKVWFKNFSDWLYQWVADHRGFMYNLSTSLLGKNPRKYKPYWVLYLFFLLAVVVSLVYFL